MAAGKKSRALAAFHWCLLIAGIGIVVHWHITYRDDSVARPPTEAELDRVFGEGHDPARRDDPLPHYLGGADAGGEPASAAAVSTTDLPPGVKGYADEINVLVAVDKTGVIRGIEVLEHRETMSFMDRVLQSGYLGRFIGKDVRQELDIDAVTGASITARAIRDDVLAASRLAARELWGIDTEAPKLPSWRGALADYRFLAALFALAAATRAGLKKRPSRRAKRTVWAISLTGLGVVAMTPFTLAHVFQLVRLDLPGPANALLALLAGWAIITTLALGPVSCAYACPFGALQELLAALPAKKWKMSAAAIRRARELRYLVLFAAIAGYFGLGVTAMAELEPMGHLFGRNFTSLSLAFIGVALGASIFVRRFWCRFFCPTGACLLILSSHRRWLSSMGRSVDESGIGGADEPAIDVDAEEADPEEKFAD